MLHHIDELQVDLVQHGLQVGLLGLVLRAEGVEHGLVLARHHQAPLDAQLVHQPGEAEAVHQHADAAHQAGLVDVNVVGRGGDVVGGRGAGFLHHGVDLLLVQPLQAADLVVDDAGLHGAATRRIDEQHDALRALVFEGLAQRGQHVLGAGLGTGRNGALDLDHGGVRRGGLGVGHAFRLDRQPDDGADHHQPEQAEEQLPAARGALLLDLREQQFLDGLALPAGTGGTGGGGGVEVLVHDGLSFRIPQV